MHLIRLAALALVAAFSIAASDAPHPNWTATIHVASDGAHVLGNPDAPIKVAEYVSYTCPHCAHFQMQSEAVMRLAYVQPGKVSVKVEHLVRDPIDLAAALLTNCGDPARFFVRHNDFLGSQETWAPKAQAASAGQRQRWGSGSLAQRMQAIAADFDFYSIVERRGIGRAEADRCLADQAMVDKLMQQRQAAIASGINATPSFTINGTVLDNTHDWAGLDAAIKQHLN